MTEARWTIRGCLGTPAIAVVGTQVGRFGVRRSLAREIHNDSEGRRARALDWCVDHIPTGASCASLPTFADAMVVADDLSRFAADDCDGTTPAVLVEQFGPALLEWLNDLDPLEVVPYRDWVAIRCGVRARELEVSA